MTTEVLTEHINTWCEVLHGVVPEELLNACYLDATRFPGRRPGPCTQDELLQAYRRILVASIGINTEGCKFCRMYAYDPTEFSICPFHGKIKHEEKGLQL